MKYKHLFGPVPSRRLGISLGIDLIPYKTCSFNCIYCECGSTTRKTTRRREFVRAQTVIKEIDDYLSQKPALDYITFAGSGEPTLNSKIGKIIDFIKKKYPSYRVAVLTNGSLLYRKSVRKSLLNADLVIPSLDAASTALFRRINRPAQGIELKKVIQGMCDFRGEYKGCLKLEIFIIPGMNDSAEELRKLKEAVQKINPDSVQLNTLVRPGAEEGISPAGRRVIEKIAAFLKPFKCEIALSFKKKAPLRLFDDGIAERIIATVKRRPVTSVELAASLGLHLNELNKYLGELVRKGGIKSKRHGGEIFLTAAGE